MCAVPSPPWNRVPPRSSIRRRDPVNRKAIVGAAIRILDIDGLDGFTMRRVAEALGTGPAAIAHTGHSDAPQPGHDSVAQPHPAGARAHRRGIGPHS